MRAQLDELDTLEERRRALTARVEEAAGRYAPLAARLSAIRRAAAGRLEARVMEELSQLAMENARFLVSIETGEAGKCREVEEPGMPLNRAEEADEAQAVWSANGADRVEFLLSANVGENARPLARVASGGELSRLMLTLRIICRGSKEPVDGRPSAGATMVFDEIDTGIGGSTAEAIGRRLQALAAHQQVLCVTHQPQIARFGDHHYAVSKKVEEGRTVTSVRELSEEERVGELARMIGGSDGVETTRETARWMLEDGVKSTVGGKPGDPRRRRSPRKKVSKIQR